MVDIAPYIKELILLNECVILPDFGGFETRYASAQYNKQSQSMMPPTKQVFFREDFKTGGEVLTDHLCKRLSIEEVEARELITNYVVQLKQQLEDRNEAVVDGVGRFTKGVGYGIFFTSFDEENYLVDSFGLDAFQIDQPQILSVPQHEKKVLKIKPRQNTLLLVVVGILVVIVLMGITMFLTSKFDIYLFNFSKGDDSDELIVLGATLTMDSLQRKIDNRIDDGTNVKSALFYSEEGTKEEEELNESISYYYLIAGSFKTERNAEMLEKELIDNGFQTKVIENGGYYRVTIGHFADKQEALMELKRMRRQINRSIWLLFVE